MIPDVDQSTILGNGAISNPALGISKSKINPVCLQRTYRRKIIDSLPERLREIMKE